MDHTSLKLTLRKQWFVSSKIDNIENTYRFESEIGTGAFGRVHKAIFIRTGQIYAIKEIQKARLKDFKTFKREVEMLKVLDHPQISKIIETYETELTCYLVMDFCEGGELFDRIIKEKTMTEYSVASIMRKLFSVVSYCHENKICHRDLKPENILLISSGPESDIKVIDFGLSKVFTEKELMHHFKGTPYYVAPEIILENYTEKVDCWSLGVIMYIMLSGTPPFYGENNEEILLRACNAHYSFNHPAFSKISPQAKDLIGRLLIKDPNIRITAQQAFQHNWIQGLAPLMNEPLNPTIYSQIASFISAQKLKKATLMFIASKMSEKDIENLKHIFVNMDADGDGLLSRTEFEDGIAENHMSIDGTYLDIVWDVMDTNENGRIDYTEFLSACLHCQQYLDSGYLQTAFEFFDQDLDGRITVAELRLVLADSHLQDRLEEEKLESIISEVDSNNDGTVDYREFIDMMHQSSNSMEEG